MNFSSNPYNAAFNPVQHQINNPSSDEPIYLLPAVEKYYKERSSTFVVPTAYDLLPADKVMKNAQKMFYDRPYGGYF